jgi:hypothetical protein
MYLVDQKIWKASKHLFKYKIYTKKFWDVKIWHLPLLLVGKEVYAHTSIIALGIWLPVGSLGFLKIAFLAYLIIVWWISRKRFEERQL